MSFKKYYVLVSVLMRSCMYVEAVDMKNARKSWNCVPHELPSVALTLSHRRPDPVFYIRVFHCNYSSRHFGMIAQLLCRRSEGMTELMPSNNSLLPLDQCGILSNAHCQLVVWHCNHDSLYLEISNPQQIICIICEYLVSPA